MKRIDGVAFALTKASRRARTRSIGSRSRARGSSLIFDHPPAVAPPPSQTKYDRALRRARKLRLRLGGDPADNEYPDKPPRMRWATYNRLLDKLRAADGVADERLRRVLINAQMSGFGG
jgi:hypothetical protein